MRKEDIMTQKFSVTGTYFEACNCHVACPCVFLSPPTEGECTALVGWHIEKGYIGETKLDGLNVAMYVHSPGNMIEGNWKAALYLDDKATQSQADGLTQIFSGKAGGHPANLAALVGQVLGIKGVQMEYKADGKRREFRIPNIVEAEIEALSGQGKAEVSISNPPLCIAPGYPAVAAKSKLFSYRDHGYQLEISGKNGFYSPFTYQGP